MLPHVTAIPKLELARLALNPAGSPRSGPFVQTYSMGDVSESTQRHRRSINLIVV